jgi:hypothetical protein
MHFLLLQRCGASHLSTLSGARRFLMQTILAFRNFITSLRTVLLGTSFSGYALMNASRTAANYFDDK